MVKKLQSGDTATDFIYDTPWESGQEFYKTAGEQTTVLFFLRYYGCPVCRMEMANLKRDIKLFEEKRAKVFVLLQSAPSTITALTSQEEWPFSIVCDPEGELFQLYGVEAGGIFKYLHPSGMAAAIKATVKGFRHGKFEGKETQLPAVFVVNRNKTIQWAYYGKTVSDVPAPALAAEKVVP